MNSRVLDARPDRIDFRDRQYRPPLVSLPDAFPPEDEIQKFLPLYLSHGKIRDQGKEGACTGFGLAAVIDYIYWDRMIRQWRRALPSTGDDEAPAAAVTSQLVPVSAHMLYDVAKLYDEWDGEDYSGSSCRGALKGWHKHGVCTELFWRDTAHPRREPTEGWREDAAQRPLGAYYRVNAQSISDLQAAVFEVRAVYCSARVHGGWHPDSLVDGPRDTMAGISVPFIPMNTEITGGHAFAIVGYNRNGFIVQNSWGRNWGYNGFAVLTYEDWARHGNDAWVAALAAPMQVAGEGVPRSRSTTALSQSVSSVPLKAVPGPRRPAPWSADKAYDHSIVLGNEGLPIRRRIDTFDAEDNLRAVAYKGPLVAARDGCKKLVIYAHGGLNSEQAAIERVMKMGPWLEANGIYPLFIVWRTSVLESLGNIGADQVSRFQEERDELRAKGLGDVLRGAVDKLQNAFDKSFEAAAEKTIGKPVWSQMKQNAGAAADGRGGSRLLFMALQDLRAKLGKEGLAMEVHMAGHSAGAILLGHLLDDFDGKSPISSATLFAPACTMEFAVRHYGRALDRKALPKGGIHIDNLSDENERRDSVGPYGKSLLYLVSRALETPRKRPLLGLARCLSSGNPSLENALSRARNRRQALAAVKDELGVDFAQSQLGFVRDWFYSARKHAVSVRIHSEPEIVVSHRVVREAGRQREKPIKTPATHGSFDNNTDVMNATVARILGTARPSVRIRDLSGF